ncbi:hypothetical protein D3C87_1167830 [compost metagenome]
MFYRRALQAVHKVELIKLNMDPISGSDAYHKALEFKRMGLRYYPIALRLLSQSIQMDPQGYRIQAEMHTSDIHRRINDIIDDC